jgi:hypothetical protein
MEEKWGRIVEDQKRFRLCVIGFTTHATKNPTYTTSLFGINPSFKLHIVRFRRLMTTFPREFQFHQKGPMELVDNSLRTLFQMSSTGPLRMATKRWHPDSHPD